MASPQGVTAGSGYQPPPQPQQPALPRSISQTNLETTKRCRAVIQQDWVPTAPAGGTNFFTSTPYFTLTLPPLTDYPEDFKHFVFDRIVDKETQEALEGEKCLNWCGTATKLVPILTLGDGNCLLHAASLGMWGFQDRDYILRRAVSHAIQSTQGNTFYQRWQHAREQDNLRHGIQLDSQQWRQEWQMVVKQASVEVPLGASLDSLEEFHVFILANILRRPIIMYAAGKVRSSYLGSTLQRVNFHGVYLPLLWHPSSCKKDPLPLAFYGGHFSALVVIEFPQQYRNGFLSLPLMDYFGQHLPVRFMLPQEDPTVLMMDYLELIQLSDQCSPYITANIICAKLMIPEVPAYLKPLISGFIDACHDAYVKRQTPALQPQMMANQLTSTPQVMTGGVQSQYPNPLGGMGTIVGSQNKCAMGCGRISETDSGLCLQCYREAQSTAHEQERSKSVSSTSDQQQAYNTFGPSQPSSASGAIKCPLCSKPGHPKFLGMCETCYQQTQVTGAGQPQQQQSDHYESLKNYQSVTPKPQTPPAVPPPRVGNADSNRSKCRTAGCDFFGTAESRFYCSKCFNENLQTILNEVGPANPSAPGTLPGRGSASGMSSVPQQQQQQHAYTSPQSATMYGQGHPSAYEVPSVTARNAEPLKCQSCREFFGSEEQGGLCHGCFLKKTKQEAQGGYQPMGGYQPITVGNPPPGQPYRTATEPHHYLPQVQAQPQQQQPLPPTTHHWEQCKTHGCANMADPRSDGYCIRCSSVPSVSQSQQFQQPPTLPPKPTPTPTPRPRTGMAAATRRVDPSYDPPSRDITTAPVTDQMSKMSVSDEGVDTASCFLCTGIGVGDSVKDKYAVCAKHANVMTSLLANLTGAGNPKPSEHPKPKPRTKIPSRELTATAPFTPVHTEPSSNYGQPITSTYTHPTTVDALQPQYSPQPAAAVYGQPLPVNTQETYPNTSQAYVQSQSQAEYQPTGYAGSSGMNPLGEDLPRRKPNPGQNMGPGQSGYGLELPESALRPHQPYTQQPHQHVRESQPPLGNQIDGIMGNVTPGTQGVMGGAVGGAMGGAIGGAVGGAMGGAVSGGSGGGPPTGADGQTYEARPLKQLCKTVGCSFKGVSELGGLCPDCYDEHYPPHIYNRNND